MPPHFMYLLLLSDGQITRGCWSSDPLLVAWVSPEIGGCSSTVNRWLYNFHYACCFYCTNQHSSNKTEKTTFNLFFVYGITFHSSNMACWKMDHLSVIFLNNFPWFASKPCLITGGHIYIHLHPSNEHHADHAAGQGPKPKAPSIMSLIRGRGAETRG